MSPLEQQIRDLKLKQAKAELFKFFMAAIETTPLNEEQKQVSEEVLAVVKTFFSERVEAIETGKEPQNETSQSSASVFTANEVAVLKELVSRAQGRIQQTPPAGASPEATKGAFAGEDDEPAPPKKPVNPNNTPDLKSDKIRFALANRHLDNKKVRVTTRQGQVRGTVVGIDAPHIIVKTETGHTVPVDLDNLVLE